MLVLAEVELIFITVAGVGLHWAYLPAGAKPQKVKNQEHKSANCFHCFQFVFGKIFAKPSVCLAFAQKGDV